MKKTMLIMLALILTISSHAQSSPKESTIKYDKTEVPCYSIEVPHEEEVAREAIKKRFKSMGADFKERKGFMEFKNVSIPEIKSGLVDAYVKVDQKSKKQKSSNVSVIITEPGVLPGQTTDHTGAAVAGGVAAVGAYGLLSSLNENAQEHGLNLEIKKQEEVIKKAEKDYSNLVKDGEDLQDKIKKLQNDLEANRNKIKNKAEDVKRQKELLVEVQGRRKGALPSVDEGASKTNQ
jgi:uncharacterized protein YoxC